MIFKPEMIEKILAGDKTVTRRPIVGNADCRYKDGRDYALQPGRGKKAVGRIRILDIRATELGHQLTILESAKEGFGSFRDFRDDWEDLYGVSWHPLQRVWRIEFELVR